MTQIQTAFETAPLRAGATRALETIDEPATAIDPIETGNRKATAIARFDEHRPVVVQACAQQRWLDTEATLLGQIRARTSVPVPPVLAAGSHDGVAYMLTPLVDGADLHERFTGLSPDTRATLAHDFGAYLAQLHDAFQFEAYGVLDEIDGSLVPSATDWNAWFENYARDALDRLPPVFDPVRPALKDLLAAPSVAESPTARLFPWDFRPGNALYADGDVRAILDWEAPLAAPASLSVAKAEYLVADWYVDDPEALRRAFRRGYETERSYPAVPRPHRAVAIVDSAVDSTGVVTNPQYPEVNRKKAVAFHRQAIEAVLASGS